MSLEYSIKRLFLGMVFIFFSQIVFAQNNANIWYFGSFAGIDFNSGSAVALTDGAMNTGEGCATISDNFGTLLFYSDGISIWNANHNVMPNGTGLMGHSSAAQSGIIVPKPGDPDIYYVFTVPAEIGTDGLRYSEVDMTLQGGLGDVTSTKNVFLAAPTEEKVTAVKHSNGNDIWIVTHLWDSDDFYAYLVSSSGVNTTPVITSSGTHHSGVQGQTHSCMKCSPDGTKLAIVCRHINSFEMFDFDASTGIVSNPVTYATLYNAGYGLEFSENGELLYLSKYGGAVEIYQWDLTTAAPGSAGTLIGTVNNTHVGALQLAPDGKIYVASMKATLPQVYDDYLGVIEFPGLVGAACNYIDEGFYLDGGASRYGLPTFIQSYLYSEVVADDVCEGDSVHFYLNSNATLDSVRWDFGDPASGAFNTSTLEDPAHLYTTTGIFNYSVIAYAVIGNDTTTGSVEVFTNPIVDLGNDTTICSAGGNTAFFDAGPGFDSYLWSTGDVTQIITPNTQGWYWVDVITGVCTSRDSVYLTVVFNAMADAGSDESICQGGSWNFNASTTLPMAASYDSLRWSGGLGSFSDPTIIRPVYNADPTETGSVMLTLTAYGTLPCGDGADDMVLTINANPSCDFTISQTDSACIDQQLQFFGSGSVDIIAWNWNFGDGNSGTGQNPVHTYTSAGIYTITLVVTNNSICTDTAINQIEIIDPVIGINVSPAQSCINSIVSFSATGNYGFSSWEWDFGDGNTATGRNVSHTYTLAGIFNVSLDYCGKTVVNQHEVFDMPFAFAGSDESICEHYSFSFSSSSSPPFVVNNSSLQWFGGAGAFNNAFLENPIYYPAVGELGPIDFMLVAYGLAGCDNDTSYMQLTIFDGPEAQYTFSPGDSICVGEEIAFNANSSTTIIDWEWNYGDGNNASGQDVVHAFSSSGNYLVMLEVTNDDDCIDTVQQSIEVFELPQADFIVFPANGVCLNTEQSFNASSTTNITSWYWDLGDGTMANTQNYSHTYAAVGTYDVNLYVYNENSCRDTMTKTVTIFELPTCDFAISPNDSSCVNELITFNGTGSGGITNWQWDFGDGNNANGQVVNYTYTIPGTYNISLIVSNADGCQDTMIHQRVVVEPVIDFTMDLTPACEGYQVNFNGVGNYAFTDYVWDFGDGNTAIGKNASHTFASGGTYTVSLSFCTSQLPHDILVYDLPLAFAGQDTISCEDVPFDLSTMPLPPMATDYASILWHGGLGTFDDPTALGPVYTPEDNEFGFVTLYMVALGNLPCHNDTSSMVIEVIPGAYAYAGSDEDHCQGELFNFANSTSPPGAWNENFRMWTGGAGTFVDPTAEVPIYIPDPNETGPITLTFVASNILNCDSIDDMILNIHPIFNETQFFEICFGDSLLLPGGEWVYQSGVYSDTLMSVWNCDSVIGTTLNVLPQIDADFTANPNDSTCMGESISFSKTGSANIISYHWDFGDGTTSTNPNPSHIYNTVGTFTVTFSYTDDIGCSDEISHSVSVFEHPDVDFTTSVTSACVDAEFLFYGASTDDILFWEWDFGDGGIGFGQNVSHTYTVFGPITVSLTVTATNLCQSTFSKTIFVAEPPTADFTYNIIKCDTIQFVDLSSAPQNYFLVEWLWYFDDGTTSNLQYPAHAYATGGVYNVSLVVSSDSAGLICTDSIAKTIVVPDRPTVYFTWTPEPTCLGDATTFFGTSGNPITSWYWDFDDGNFGTVQNPEHTYIAPGVYNVMLLATDENGCWDTIAHDVTVSDIPDVSFTVDPNPSCAGEQTSFAGSSTSTIATWLWDFGDGGSSVDQNPLHVYAAAGSYQVTLWVGDTANCFNQTTQWVIVNPMPLPDFAHSGITCEGDSVFFYNQSTSPNGTISQWIWEFGDGNSVTINAPNDPDIGHVYGSGGTFNVTLTVVDIDSCSNFITKPVTITPGPTADFNYEDNCNGQAVEFTDLSSPEGGSPIVLWFWEFGDPASGSLNTSTLQDPTHLFSSPGTFDVLMVATNADGCADTVVLPVSVSMAPMVSFTTDSDSACVNGEMAFYGSASTSVTWSWDFGDGGVSVLQEPVHVYAAPGTYTVTVVVEDAGGCVGTYSSDVYINPLPISDFTFSSLPCSGSAVDFIDISSAMNSYMLDWHWYFGDGSDTVLFAPGPGNISHTYATPGNYTVSLAIENVNTCEDSIAYQVSVIQGPEAVFESSGDVCLGGTLEFTDMSQGFGSVIQGWLWSFGDPASGSNNQSTLQNPTHVYSSAGTFFVSLIVTSNTGCQHTTVDTVDIAPPPAVDWFVNPDTTCFGDLTYFFTDVDTTIISEVITYGWSFGDPTSGINDTSNLQNPVHQYTAAGTFVVTMSIINVDGCMNTSIHEVDIKAAPIADYSYEQSCLNDSTLFFDESVSQTAVITAWMWNFGDPDSGALNTSDLQNTGHVFTDLGTYNVELITTDYFGCSDTIMKTIAVDYAPTSFFTHSQPCELAGLIYFSDSSFVQVGAAPIVEWLWELEPGQYSSEINPIYTFSEYDTIYVVYLAVTDANGCENTWKDSVYVSAPLDLDFVVGRVCLGESTFFEGIYMPEDDSIVSWTWDFNDGNVLTGISDTISYEFQQSGTYYVVLEVENITGCIKSKMHEVIVDALPEPDFSFSPSICNETTYFTDWSDPGYGAMIDSWHWTFGDLLSGSANASSQQNPVHLYPPQDSTYLVNLILTNSFGCIDSIMKEVSKGLCLQAVFEPSTQSQCNNAEVCFIDSSYIVGDGYSIQTWRWAFGDGLWAEYDEYQDTVCHEYETSGAYTVQLIIFSEIDGLMFSDTTYREVMVSAVPSAALAFQSPCAEGITKFFDISDTYNVEIVSWQWDFGVEVIDTDTSSLKDPTYSYLSAGIYTIQLIVENANGCLDTTYTDMQVFNNPDAAFSSSNACAGGMTEFTDESIPAEGELANWQWSFGDGGNANYQYPAYVYADTGNFLVQMIVTDDNQCTDTTQNMLSVHPVPLSAFDIIDRYESIQGQILLDNLSENAIRYEWDLGNGDTSEMFTPVVRYEDNGTYLIELISWNDNNCPDTAYMEYIVEFQGLYVPTGFTPESNIVALREFKPVGINLEYYEVTVINNRGIIVFKSNVLDDFGSPAEGWDGTVNGEPQPTGNYIWTITAKFKDGSTWNGTDVGDGNEETFGKVVLIR